MGVRGGGGAAATGYPSRMGAAGRAGSTPSEPSGTCPPSPAVPLAPGSSGRPCPFPGPLPLGPGLRLDEVCSLCHPGPVSLSARSRPAPNQHGRPMPPPSGGPGRHTRSAPHPRPSCGPGSEGTCVPTTRRPGSASGEGTGTWGSTAVSATTVPSPHPHGAERNLPAPGYAKAEGPHEAPGQARAGRSLCLTQAPATPVGAGPRRAPARSPASPRSAASARPQRSVGHTAASRLGTDARNRAQEGRPWHRATEALPAPDASTRESLLGIIKISCLLARDL